ncbi:MAG: thermonuclease family protein [Rhodospirillaceae bacterium]
MIRILSLFLTILISSAAATAAEPIVGQASVIDGDTLDIHGARIRFHGIDAPESGQSCSAAGKAWRCGQQAALALSDRIGKKVVSCAPKDRDRYGRVVAVCSAGGEDLNGWMVAEGWALAYRQYSSDYVSREQAASIAKLGIWRGEFVPPWDWRRGTRLSTAAASPAAETAGKCLIKGNIGKGNARIYHVPGGAFYERTRIDASKGEKLFCSEAEAQAAGWRRSKR